jgi:broad specificity phosphatase PhoE
MRYLEVRRHTMRGLGGQELSPPGIALAQRVGAETGPFERVITSTLARAYQTAIAMGLTVDAQDERLSTLDWADTIGVAWDVPFVALAAQVKADRSMQYFAERVAAHWQSFLEDVPDNCTVLAVSHSGVIEAGAVACLPDADHRSWGGAFSYCEGVRLVLDDGHFTGAEILRVG